jgi:hypothetical protein
LVGAWGACGGPGERRGDGVPVRGSTSGRHPRSPAEQPKIETPRGTDWLTCTRAAVENYPGSRATRRYDGTKIGSSEIATQCNSESRPSAPDNSNRLRFLRVTTCGNARQPTCPDRALDRSALRDEKATQTGDLGFEQPERQDEGDKHKPGVRVPASEVRSCYLIFPSIGHMQRRRTEGPVLPSCLGDRGIKISR